MDAPARNWFGTLQAAFVLLGLSFLLAVPLSWLRYTRSHLENQGVDPVHHLIITYDLAARDGPPVGDMLTTYPATSHRLAVWSAPLFGDRLLLALRYASLATMLALVALPYVLLCRVFSPLPALGLLMAWHLVCYWLKVDGLNHFMWEGQFNYSRAVGTLGLWMALIALSTSARGLPSFLGTQALAIACGCLALACHIAPGAVTFGAVLACQVAWCLRDRTAVHLGCCAATLAAAAGMVFGTEVWTLMVKVAGVDGGLPVGPHRYLLVWVPVLLIGLALYFARLTRGRFAGDEGDRLEMALLAALLAGGALQGYLAARMFLAGTVAAYAIKSIYFITFPVASLVLLRWAAHLPVRELPRWHVPACVVAVALLAGVYGHRWIKDERAGNARILTPSDGWVVPPPERLPEAVVHRLRGSSDELAGYYYFDPQQIHGSYYANMAGLRGQQRKVLAVYAALNNNLAGQAGPAEVREALARCNYVGLALPEWADPSRHARGLGPAVRSGRYWKCLLPAVVAGRPENSRR